MARNIAHRFRFRCVTQRLDRAPRSTPSFTISERRLKTCTVRTTSNAAFQRHNEQHTCTAKLIINSKDRMYTVDSGASPHSMGASAPPALERTHQENRRLGENTNRERYCPFHLRDEGLHPGARHLFVREVAGRFSFQYCRKTIMR